jgi:hypothetical protein
VRKESEIRSGKLGIASRVTVQELFLYDVPVSGMRRLWCKGKRKDETE